MVKNETFEGNQRTQSSGVKKLAKKIFALKETAIFLTIIALSIILSILSPYFLTVSNILTVLRGLSSDGIIVVGMTIILILGGIDLSVGSVMGLTGMTAAYLASSGTNIWLAVIAALLVGVACGLINGLFIGKVGLSPFITTLAMMGIARGATLLATQGASISLYTNSKSFEAIGQGDIFGIPIIVIIFLVIAIIGDFMLRYSQPFRKVFYIGSNEKAATLSGINITRVKIGIYVLISVLASVAGVLSLARFGAATPTTGTGAEMIAISAAVIGGASLSGGEGSILGAFLGVILLNVVNNGLILLNVSVYGQGLISGLILLFAVTIDHISHKKRVMKLH
ncbi:ABC transporter permease [Desulfosporosinus metallidurans]|uniref:Ribose ABC transport system, permease protein RbsC n=1 Tax=Desulfosporosinus metallidurans TaxID=1888891 RepID=A0A1Q8QZH1_9FIRM|nr:ABC transporter permease [Desulfosporosinus metallidurans]OLN32737.1 Ribose ABC transport system, permease protein RbsC [Desulfosporosinus metallidurans]